MVKEGCILLIGSGFAPQKLGGLDLRSARQMNQASLMKARWQLIVQIKGGHVGQSHSVKIQTRERYYS